MERKLGKLFQRNKKALTAEQKLKRKRRRRIIWLSIIGTLIIIRLILPYIVLRYVNNKLAHLEEYYGHVEDIDLHLYRGAYEIKDMHLVKKVKTGRVSDTIPFFRSPSIDLSVEWSSLWEGSIVGEIVVEQPVLNFVREAHKGEDVRADTADFFQLVDDLMPITVNRFDIHKGEIHYVDPEPRLDVAMKNIEVTATNLTNVTDSKELLPATLKGTGDAYAGKFSLNMKFDGLAKVPTFDMNAEMKSLNLVQLNDMLREYGNFDVKKGHFNMYTEFAAKDGKFGGYVKPIVKDLDVVQWTKEEGDFKQILWETLIGTTAEILQNQKEEQLATNVPINGTFDKSHVNLWHAIGYVLRNAFLHALKPSFDHTININQLKGGKKTLLEQVFDAKGDGKNDGGDKKDQRKNRRETRREEQKKQ